MYKLPIFGGRLYFFFICINCYFTKTIHVNKSKSRRKTEQIWYFKQTKTWHTIIFQINEVINIYKTHSEHVNEPLCVCVQHHWQWNVSIQILHTFRIVDHWNHCVLYKQHFQSIFVFSNCNRKVWSTKFTKELNPYSGNKMEGVLLVSQIHCFLITSILSFNIWLWIAQQMIYFFF